MKAVKVLGLAVMFGFMVSGISLASDLKIAYVDLSKVFDSYQKTKDFDDALQVEGKAFQSDLEGRIQKIKDAQDKLNLMKDSEKQSLQDDIEKQRNDAVSFEKEKRVELAKKRDGELHDILTEIQKVASDIAKKEGYNYVLNNSVSVVIYGDTQFNITDEVLKTLNDSYKK